MIINFSAIKIKPANAPLQMVSHNREEGLLMVNPKGIKPNTNTILLEQLRPSRDVIALPQRVQHIRGLIGQVPIWVRCIARTKNIEAFLTAVINDRSQSNEKRVFTEALTNNIIHQTALLKPSRLGDMTYDSVHIAPIRERGPHGSLFYDYYQQGATYKIPVMLKLPLDIERGHWLWSYNRDKDLAAMNKLQGNAIKAVVLSGVNKPGCNITTALSKDQLDALARGNIRFDDENNVYIGNSCLPDINSTSASVEPVSMFVTALSQTAQKIIRLRLKTLLARWQSDY